MESQKKNKDFFKTYCTKKKTKPLHNSAMENIDGDTTISESEKQVFKGRSIKES